MISIMLLALWGLVLGLITGFTSMGTGLIGGPALIYLFSIKPVMAVANISATALFLMAAGAFRHVRARNISWHLALPLSFGSIPAAFLTASFAGIINSYVSLKYIIGGVVLLSLPLLLYRFFMKKQELSSPEPTLLQKIIAFPVGIVLGAIMGTTGIVGSITLVSLLLIFKLDTSRAVGTTALIGFLSLSFAALAHGIEGNIDFELVAVLIPGVVVGAYTGARLVDRAPKKVLHVAIILLLLVSGIVVFL